MDTSATDFQKGLSQASARERTSSVPRKANERTPLPSPLPSPLPLGGREGDSCGRAFRQDTPIAMRVFGKSALIAALAVCLGGCSALQQFTTVSSDPPVVA